MSGTSESRLNSIVSFARPATNLTKLFFQFMLVSCLFTVSDLSIYFGLLLCIAFALSTLKVHKPSSTLMFILIATSGSMPHSFPSHGNKLLALASDVNNSEQPSSYRLIGSGLSYAQYFPWYPCLDGLLVFEFKTHEPNGLLLYTQALPYKYIQINLVEGEHYRTQSCFWFNLWDG